MRDIKFRAWDEGNKRMVEVKDLTFLDDGVLAGFKTIGNQERTLNKPNVMQYTGLKDRNGKEIYQSDRLKTESGECEVVWYDEGACFRYKFGDNLESPLNYDSVEVIGNIYEN